MLAFDLGTSGVKAALVTPEGAVAASATAGYPYYVPARGWAEQAPEDYWQGVCKVTREVVTKAAAQSQQILGIAFGTLWKGIIPIDRQGKVLRSSILWMDCRAVDQSKKLNEHFATSRFSPSDYWSKLLWLREKEPEVMEKAHLILEVNSYLKWRATGNAAVDISNCFTRSFDPTLDSFDEKVLEFSEISRDKFPPIVRASDRVGALTEMAAEELGLIPGIPVYGGNTDIQGVTVGAGSARIGGVHLYLGSSGWIGFTVAHTEHSNGASFDEKRDVLLAGMKSVGLSLTWLAKTLYPHELTRMGDGVYGLMDREAEKIPAGSGGVLATPWINGEYPPQADLNAGAGFLNLRADQGRGHMTRALLEGICFHLRQRTEFICNGGGLPWPERINAVGGGACSGVWMQMLADILNVTVQVPDSPRHAGAVGTAYSALIGLGLCPDYETAGERLCMHRCYTPDPQNAAIYGRIYSAYTQLYTAMKPIFEIMNEMRNTE